nr:hypothetical protein [Tanacetum cinerariifolium]
MLLCKQAEQGVPLQAEQYDWLADMDEEVDEQELEAHYSYMAKIQEVPTVDTDTDSEPVEHVQNDAGYNVFTNDLQHFEQIKSVSNTCLVETDDSNVVPNSPDMCEDSKAIKESKHNTCLRTKECKAILVETSKSLGKSISVRDSCLVALQNKQTEFEKYKAFNDRTIDYDKLERQLSETLGNRKSMDTKFDKSSVVRQPNAQRIPKPSVIGKPAPFSDSLKRRYFPKTKSVPKTNVSEGLSKPVTAQNLPKTAGQAVSNTNVLKPGMYRIDNRIAHTRAPQLPQNARNTNPHVSTFTGVNHKPNVSRPQLKINQSRDKVLQNNSQVKFKKTQVEVHPRISSVSNKLKSVTGCKDSFNFRTLNANVVCATYNKCLVDSNHLACVTKLLNDVHARTKKPIVVPISTRKPKSPANKSIATSNKKKVASKSTNQKPQSNFRVLYENTNKAWKWWIERQSPSGYKWVPKTKKQWVPKAKMQWIVQLILFIVDSGCTKHMTGNLKLLCNFIEKFLGTVRFGNDQFALILGYGDLAQGNVTINRATPTQAWLWHPRLSHLNFDYINLLSKNDIVIALPKLKGTEFLNKTLNAFSKKKELSIKLLLLEHLNRMALSKDETRWRKSGQGKGGSVHTEVSETSVANNTSGLVPQRQKALDYDNPDLVPQRQDVYSSADADVPSQQELDILFGPLYDEFFNADFNPSTNIQSTSAPSTHSNVDAEENNDQAEEGEQNPFCAPAQEEVESSSHNIGNSNVPNFIHHKFLNTDGRKITC